MQFFFYLCHKFCLISDVHNVEKKNVKVMQKKRYNISKMFSEQTMKHLICSFHAVNK